jgi:hypothetical protein
MNHQRITLSAKLMNLIYLVFPDKLYISEIFKSPIQCEKDELISKSSSYLRRDSLSRVNRIKFQNPFNFSYSAFYELLAVVLPLFYENFDCSMINSPYKSHKLQTIDYIFAKKGFIHLSSYSKDSSIERIPEGITGSIVLKPASTRGVADVLIDKQSYIPKN